ncbi:MAG TPA: hypothetical protein VGV13_14885 [Methylomirabilota bacterium]|nr:hypothetical protein [Methylomirabilota bacterium]
MDQVIAEELAEAQHPLEERGPVGSGPDRVGRIVAACEPLDQRSRFVLSVVVTRFIYACVVTHLDTEFEGTKRYLERQIQEVEPPPN